MPSYEQLKEAVAKLQRRIEEFVEDQRGPLEARMEHLAVWVKKTFNHNPMSARAFEGTLIEGVEKLQAERDQFQEQIQAVRDQCDSHSCKVLEQKQLAHIEELQVELAAVCVTNVKLCNQNAAIEKFFKARIDRLEQELGTIDADRFAAYQVAIKQSALIDRLAEGLRGIHNHGASGAVRLDPDDIQHYCPTCALLAEVAAQSKPKEAEKK